MYVETVDCCAVIFARDVQLLTFVGGTGNVLRRPFSFYFYRATSSGRPRQPGEIIVGFSGDAIKFVRYQTVSSGLTH